MTRTTHTRPDRRSGVTLIELLVVIAIIGILIALTSAALQKTVEGQNIKSSEAQVFKLQQALDQEYDRVVQKCARDAESGAIPRELVDYCEGNVARAKAMWTAFSLMQHFPQSFGEASATIFILKGPPPATAANIIVTLKPKATFAAVAGWTAASANEESGALLYLILATQSVSGGGAMATAADDLSQAMKRKVTVTSGATTKEMETFADAWKHTVGFRRWDYSDEVQTGGYVDPKLAASANKDALDPQNLVFGWTPNTTERQQLKAYLGFTGRNRTACVYSVGKDNTVGTADDVLGYRLRKQGQRGTTP